jgi:hypothetical protein
MNPRFTITHSVTQGLARIERVRGFLEAAQLSEDWVRQMSERALLLEAHHTTHIEGTRLTLDEAERLLAGQPVPQANADDVRELLNYRDAFHLVSNYLDSGAPITEGLIREIHKRLVAGVRGGQAQPGEYRLVQNYFDGMAGVLCHRAVHPVGGGQDAGDTCDSGGHPRTAKAIEPTANARHPLPAFPAHDDDPGLRTALSIGRAPYSAAGLEGPGGEAIGCRRRQFSNRSEPQLSDPSRSMTCCDRLL